MRSVGECWTTTQKRVMPKFGILARQPLALGGTIVNQDEKFHLNNVFIFSNQPTGNRSIFR